MRRRILVWLTALVVAMTMMFGGSVSVSAGTTPAVGAEQWYFYGGGWADGKTVSPPSYADGNVYFMLDDGSSTKLMKVAASETGEVTTSNSKVSVVASFEGIKLGWGLTPPTIDGNKIYLPLTGGVGIVNTDGDSKSFVATESEYQTISQIAYDANYIYTGTYDSSDKGKYTRISKNGNAKTVMVDGTGSENTDCFYWAGAYPLTKDGTSYVMFGSDSGMIYLYDNNNNKVADTFDASGKIRSSIVTDGNYYYFSTNAGKMYKLSVGGTEGKAELIVAGGWPVELAGASTCTPVISGETVYVGSDNKSVEAFNKESGSKITDNSKTGLPSVVKNITLLNGNVYFPNNTEADGGIFDVTNNQSYFTPVNKNKRQYNIYSIATNGTDMMFFKNDSGYVTAVKTAPNSHKITANLVGDGGTLAPKSPQSIYVSNDGSYVFTAKSNDGYKLALAKKVSGEADISIKDDSVILDNVKGDVVFEVSFTKAEPREVNVTVTAQSYDTAEKNKFNGINKKLRVSSTISQEYGYSDGVSDGVSALDVILSFYKDVLNISKDKISNALVISRGDYGAAVNKWFGTVGDKTMDFSYAVNYNPGNAVDAQIIQSGDKIDIFGYYDENYADVLSWFENSKGEKLQTIKVKENEKFTLSLKGYQFAAYPKPDSSVIPNAMITMVDSSGKQSQISDTKTDEEGNVILRFKDAGKYTISAYGTLDGKTPIYNDTWEVTGYNDVKGRLASPAVQITVTDSQGGNAFGIGTGDDFNMIGFIIIAGIALAAALSTIVISRRKINK